MTKNVQMVGQPTAQASTFVGLSRQIIIDTDLLAIRVHDGVTPGGSLTLSAINNLGEVADRAIARNNLGLGDAAVQNTTAFDAAGVAATLSAAAQTAAIAAAQASSCQRASNLSDVINPSTARSNLGLGAAAVQPLTAFLQPSNNLSDLINASTARGNLGLGTAAVQNSTAFGSAADVVTAQNTANTAVTNAATAQTAANVAQSTANAAAVKTNNLSDLANATTARGNLGFKTYTSADTSFPGSAADITFSHNFGFMPFSVQYFLVVQSLTAGYAIGDIIEISPGGIAGFNNGFASRRTVNDIVLGFGSSGLLDYPNKTTRSGATIPTFGASAVKLRVTAFGAG